MKRWSEMVSLYYRMIVRYSKMFAKRSYAHNDQGVGKHFLPGHLAGYYNDLSGKIDWRGPVDNRGLPVVRVPGGKMAHLPTVLIQKGLGHWEAWLSSGKQSMQHWEAFLQLTQWALGAQDESGGWKVWPPYFGSATPYSAMTQGEGISLFVRAYSVTGEQKYLEGARRALTLIITPIDKGGTNWLSPAGLVLEEKPFEIPKTILNGWIFALYGLYDLTIIDGDRKAREASEATLKALIAYLDRYNAGFWSFYDTSGTLASPFYHRLHIAQLEALELTYPEHRKQFARLRKTFERQLKSPLNRTVALAMKSYQKLRRPPEYLRA